MDIGTNSIRLLVVRIEPNHSYSILHRLKETVRLGEGEFDSHFLQPEAMERAVGVVRQFAQVARAAGAEQIDAVATAATREAENRDSFLNRLAVEAGVNVRLISGKEEARLIYLGISTGTELGHDPVVCVDIGGGSTEIIVGSEQEYLFLDSLKLGAIRLSALHLAGQKGAISDRLYREIRDHVRRNVAQTIHEIKGFRLTTMVGSSGTIENLADIAARLFLQRARRREDTFSREQIRRTISFLRSVSLSDRARVPGINPNRADIIIGGAAILDVLMDELSIKELRISDRGLREGILADHLMREGHGSLVEGLSVRDRSVLQLGRNCRFDEPHARATARLALELFDSGGEAGLHAFGDAERELLRFAALLHHIGSFLTHTGYERHTNYMVRNAELLGFDEAELVLLANICLYHRGSLPRPRDPEYGSLSSAAQERVRTLSLILRLAENLDKSRSGVVLNAVFLTRRGGGIELRVDAESECPVELAGLRNQADAFEKTTGRPLTISCRVEALC